MSSNLDSVTSHRISPEEASLSVYTVLREAVDPLEGTDALATLWTVQSDVDMLTRKRVQECRAAGVTWEAIGRALHVTRSAAQQRFGS